MSRQYFDDLQNEPLNIANAAVSFTTTELALFPNVAQIAIPAATVCPGKVWRLTAGGIWTSPGAGTLIITPRWGTSTGGISLGASPAQTLSAAAAASQWFVIALLMCRTMGLSGANSTFVAQGTFTGQGAIATAASTNNVCFGGTASAVCDPTLGGFQLGFTFSTTGASMTPQIVCLQSLN